MSISIAHLAAGRLARFFMVHCWKGYHIIGGDSFEKDTELTSHKDI